MTYQEYYNALINELTVRKNRIADIYKSTIANGGFKDPKILGTYIDLQNSLYPIMSKCNEVLNLMENEDVNPNSQINTDILKIDTFAQITEY